MPDSSSTPGPAPLLDRELFFGDPEISQSDLSPDGRTISFVKPYRGVRNLWVKGVDEPFDEARPVTADERPVPGYFWSRDGSRLLYVQDAGGNEDFHLFAVDPAQEIDADTGVPPALDLTPIEGVRASIYSLPRDRPGVILVGLNDRDPAEHDVYEIDLSTGERKLQRQNDGGVVGWVFDHDGELRLATRQTADGGTELLSVSDQGLDVLQTATVDESLIPYRFLPDNERVYVVSNCGEAVDLHRLLLLDPATGEQELVETDPLGEVDLSMAVFDRRTEELIATVYVGDRQRLYPRDDELSADLAFLAKELPDGDLDILGSSDDMQTHLVAVSRDVDPGSVYLYRRPAESAGPRVELLYRSRPELPSEALAECTPLRYTARDGLEIPALLTLPKGVPAEGLPLVVHPHGGPWARDYWGYSPFPQFLANRGYAVVQPNFRGSLGFGKSFMNAGNREWGTGAMQHDISDAVAHLVERGIADPERVGIFGGSYGGYATLAGVTFTPELYRCGVPFVAPSNLITLVESFPAYWRPLLQGTWFYRVGDPEVPADREDLIARSPLFSVDQIEAPLLVVHGANDPRVKQHESDQIVVALRDKGKAVEYVVAPDEGHGFRAPLNNLALAAAMERFLAKHLGGRAQEDMSAEVTERLSAITVEPSEVVVAPGD
ncbi:MAG: S9 family peptidase [Acidobacteriota bacterium]